MKSTLAVTCTVMISFFAMLKSADKCTIQEEYQKKVEEGEPLGIDCGFYGTPYLQHANYSIHWYINGSEMAISKQNSSRIRQRDGMLCFFPALYQDSGSYECIARYRNSTRCYKSIVQIEVLSSSGALCFNEKLSHTQKLPVSTNSKLVCYYLDDLGEVDDLSIYWYKDCKLLVGQRFEFFGEELIIKNVREDDKGKYQCKGSYSYLGHKYNFSRSILVTVTGNEWKRTEILHPRNITIEAELGSNVFTECNVSSFRNTFISISWRVNNTLVDNLFKGRIQEGIQKDYLVDGAQLSVVSLNITKLEREDYNQFFVCHAGTVAAYITIQPPTKNLTGLAALVLLIIIPILICLLLKIEIVLWYRKLCLPFCHKKVSDGKIYDAYVLYPKSDTQNHFALKVLPEVLEKQCGYNLFILGRDDLPGKAVVSVVDETVQQSRRLIIILVPGLEPCPEEAPEQHIAMYHALVPAGMKVILIEMGKIKDYSNMPESIRYIKQKQGAIRWKGDLTERSSYSTHNKFWKKVRYLMPPERPISPALSVRLSSLNTCERTETS
nr:interleukin-1 receptor-like 2 isoform X1 [Pogona vitticeps]